NFGLNRWASQSRFVGKSATVVAWRHSPWLASRSPARAVNDPNAHRAGPRLAPFPYQEGSMRRLVAVLGIAVGTACQSRTSATATSPVSVDIDNKPAGPMASSIAVLTFVSGENQQPVGAAKVTVDGRTYVTGGSGQVAVDRGSREVDVQAPGFLERRASFSG